MMAAGSGRIRFAPQRIPNCVGWFSAARGCATTSASLDANIATGWTPSAAASVSATGSGYRITATSTSTPQVTGTPTNVATNSSGQPPITYTWQFQYTSGQVAWVLVETSSTVSSNNRTWFRIDDSATVGTSGANHSNASISAPDVNGRRTATVTSNAAATASVFRFRIVSGDGATTATGMTGLYFDVFTDANLCRQVRVAALVNRVSGSSLAQATADNQPGYEATGFNGRPSVRAYVAADSNIQYMLSSEAALLLGTDGDFTFMAAVDVKSVSGISSSLFGQGNSGTANPGIAFGCLATTGAQRCVTIDDAGGVKSATGATALGQHVLEYYGGTGFSGRVDGGSESPTSGDVDVGARTLNRSALFALPRAVVTAGCNASLADKVFFKRNLSAAERSYIRRGLARESRVAGVAA